MESRGTPASSRPGDVTCSGKTGRVRADATLAGEVVRRFGGRYSTELHIDLDAGDAEAERWFVACTLFGTRISARIAERSFAQLVGAGINRIVDARDRDWDDLVALLDAGGYARYDFRTATRLQELARIVADRYGGEVAAIGRQFRDPEALVAALDELPGWGPVTVGLFLRELRGVWPGARLPLDTRAEDAACHLGLLSGRGGDALSRVALLAAGAGYDERDLEAALVRLALAHRRIADCPGGRRCVALTAHREVDAAPA